MMELRIGQTVSWITRPVPGGYLQGTVIKIGAKKICIEVQSPKTGERRIKWVDAKSLKGGSQW